LNKSSTYFDFNGDGIVGHTAWVDGNDGILVIDLDKNGGFNSDGVIDQGRELIFTQWAPGSKTDMEALRKVFDSNGDGKLSAQDRYFGAFRIWVDADEDGVVDKGQLKTLSELGLSWILVSVLAIVRAP
jgi:hypothetical protein